MLLLRENDPLPSLLIEAVTKPGLIAEGYSHFHNYSVGNQVLALVQCLRRGIAPGPVNTYPGWQRLGRQVRKGEKAITLCMPVTGKRRDGGAQPVDECQREQGAAFTFFIYKPKWFVMNQTDGEPAPASPTPGWDKGLALSVLGIRETPFEHVDGNVQGYARRREIAVSPIAAVPHKTTFHELAHVVLGHTAEREVADGEHTPRSLGEVEAEAVALICCESLGLPGAEYCRGYIQEWLRGLNEIPERSAQKVFAAADSILKAGTAASVTGAAPVAG